MTTAEVLESAANVIDDRGHCKGMFESFDGAVCAMGAISLVMVGSPDANAYGRIVSFSPAVTELGRAIFPSRSHSCIPVWNDMPETTQEEVSSTMRATALLLRAQEAKSVTPEAVTA